MICGMCKLGGGLGTKEDPPDLFQKVYSTADGGKLMVSIEQLRNWAREQLDYYKKHGILPYSNPSEADFAKVDAKIEILEEVLDLLK